jgi:hypothetical protein
MTPTAKRIAKTSRTILGWKEFVRLPKLNIGPIVAKIDTGARSAALHADDIVVRGDRVRFVIEEHGRRYIHYAPLISERRVKSSSGHVEIRAVIESDVHIGKHKITTEITLTNRSDMGVPMLLGRAAVKAHFVVHPGKTFMLNKKKSKTP